MISVGAKSIERAVKQLDKAVELMVNANLIKEVSIKPKVQNIVGLINIGKRLDIESLANKLNKSIYEPDQFPGLIYRVDRFSLLVFASGKIVIAGAKSMEDIDRAIDIISPIVKH